jgi:hypothetical protein
MIICEFCLQYRKNGECAYGLNLPKGMGCREFDPGIEKFCSDPNDFVSRSQIVQMANFFGIKGTELKKVKLIAAREETIRKIPATRTASIASNDSQG